VVTQYRRITPEDAQSRSLLWSTVGTSLFVAAAFIALAAIAEATNYLPQVSGRNESKSGVISRCSRSDGSRAPILYVWLDGDSSTFYRRKGPNDILPQLEALCAQHARVLIAYETYRRPNSEVRWINGLDVLMPEPRNVIPATPPTRRITGTAAATICLLLCLCALFCRSRRDPDPPTPATLAESDIFSARIVLFGLGALLPLVGWPVYHAREMWGPVAVAAVFAPCAMWAAMELKGQGPARRRRAANGRVKKDDAAMIVSWREPGEFTYVIAVPFFGLAALAAPLGARSLLFGTVTVSAAYAGLVNRINRTTVRFRGTSWTVERGPLPWFGARMLTVESGEDCSIDMSTRMNGSSPVYDLSLVSQPLGAVRIAAVASRPDAELISQHLEALLRLSMDRPLQSVER